MLPSISATDKDDKDLFTQITVSDWKLEYGFFVNKIEFG